MAAVAGAAALLGVGLTGCASNAPAAQAPPMAMSDAAFPPFAHIHGFGINESTGIGYVATHTGLYELPSFKSSAVSASSLGGPIGGGQEDLMGFVLRGEHAFASGHPAAPGNSGPDLGLIEATPADGKWRTIALGGTTDFHDLDVVARPGGTFTSFGYNADTNKVNVSHDSGATWSAGDTINLRDLTADADAPGVLYATTADGLMLSRTYGVHWEVDPGAPLLYLVESLNAKGGGALVGVDVNQQIWTKTASGGWRKTGILRGKADALSYSSASGGRLLADDGRGIIISGDLGTTWKVLVHK